MPKGKKRRRGRRKSTALVRSAGRAVRRRYRRGGGFLGGIIPTGDELMNTGLGALGYVAGKALAEKQFPQLSSYLTAGGTALVVHAAGNMLMRNREIGKAAIAGAMIDIIRDSGILATFGLGDYYADYYSDVVHLGTSGGGVALPSNGPAINDPGRHHARHRFHDGGGAYGSGYGAH